MGRYNPKRVDIDKLRAKQEVTRRIKALGINPEHVYSGMFPAASEMEVYPEAMLLLCEMAEHGIGCMVSEMETPSNPADKIRYNYIRDAKVNAGKWLRNHGYRVPWTTPKEAR